MYNNNIRVVSRTGTKRIVSRCNVHIITIIIIIIVHTHQQMYRECTQYSYDDRTQRAHHGTGVFERAGHGQNSRAQAGL